MRHRSRKAKGRRLQVEVAEMLAYAFHLTIEATPPTKPGVRANRVVYVNEGENPDLRVRQMSEAGADVALLTSKAQAKIALYKEPLHIECKNSESWSFDANFWRTADSAFLRNALEQAGNSSRLSGSLPIVVLSKNRWDAIVVWSPMDELEDVGATEGVLMTWRNLAAMPLKGFITILDGARDG